MPDGNNDARSASARSYVIRHSEAAATARLALVTAGVPERHAKTQVDLLLAAELSGRPSHGLMRLPRIVERIRNGVCDPDATGRQEWRRDCYLLVDGQQGLGPVVACAALDAISARARERGVSLAAIHHNNHLGMLGWYVERVAANGQAAIALCTSEALVHPWGGRQAMLGTNPIAIGIPASPGPLVLDMATSIVSMGQIHDYARRGQPIPAGWALDQSGEQTTDAEAAKAGSIAPFGGPKGYALALAIEALVTHLSGAALGVDVSGTLDATNVCNKGDVFIVIQPQLGEIGSAISAYLDVVRASPPRVPGKPIMVPGDPERAHRTELMRDGICVPDGVWDEIVALAGAPTPTRPRKVESGMR